MLDEAKADPNLKLKIGLSITAASIFCSCRVICAQAVGATSSEGFPADKTHIENEKQPRGLITTRMDPAYWITKSIHHVSWAARGKRWAKRRHARLGLQDSARGRSMIERLVIWHGVTDRSLTDQYWPMALQPRRRIATARRLYWLCLQTAGFLVATPLRGPYCIPYMGVKFPSKLVESNPLPFLPLFSSPTFLSPSPKSC